MIQSDAGIYYCVAWKHDVESSIRGMIVLREYGTSPRAAWKLFLDGSYETREQWKRKGKCVVRFRIGVQFKEQL